MIVTKTPLRISFFGGGSDIPEYFKYNRGTTVSATIDRCIYLAVNTCESNHIRMTYSEMECVENIHELKHDRVRESLKYYNINNNIEICSFSDVPTKGTGLGSSSTFTVGLLNALNHIVNNVELNKEQMAILACMIEIEKCKEPIGFQDQYAAAYGGLNIIEYDNYMVDVKTITQRNIERLDKNLFLYNTGINRQASSVLTEQVESLKKKINVEYTKQIVEIAEQSIKYLMKRKFDDFGALLDETWKIKKNLSSNISNYIIDEMYETAMKSGALGGKIVGAGGGGYLLLYAPMKNHSKLEEAMTKYKKLDFNFENEGSKLVKI